MTRICVTFVFLTLAATPAFATDFSKEQLQQLEQILTKHEQCVRAESNAEIVSQSKNTRPSCATVAIAAVMTAIPAESREAPTVEGQNVAASGSGEKGPAGVFFNGTGPATIDRDSGKNVPKFDITATTDSSKVSFNWSHDVSSVLQRSGDGKGSGSFSSFSTSLSAPVSKSDSGRTNVATLDGFANASTLTLGYHKFFINGLRTPEGELTLADLESACKAADIDIDKEACDSKAIQQRVANTGTINLDPKVAAFFFNPDAFKWAYGVTATVGQQAYDWFDTKTLASQTTEKIPWSAGVYAGFIPAKWNSFLSAGAQFQRSYTAQKAKVECPAFNGTPPFQCVNGSVGTPKETDKRLVYVEDRTDLGFVAMDLRVTHDFASGDNGVDVPIYLFKDPKSTWTGGIRMGWTNTDHFDVGLFVGSTFGVFP